MRMACLMLALPGAVSPLLSSSGHAARTLGAHAAAEPAPTGSRVLLQQVGFCAEGRASS